MIEKIISGGQTGVDRGSLLAAMAVGIPHGGWCPKGRRAEDGVIPDHFFLEECDSRDYLVRTRLNVESSDRTLILVKGPGLKVSRGSAKTAQIAARLGKSYMVMGIDRPEAMEAVVAWLLAGKPKILNIAGHRESHFPGIQVESRDFMIKVLEALKR